MSSSPGTPKRKGLRSLLPGSFGRSRSRSSSWSSQRPNVDPLSPTTGSDHGPGLTQGVIPATSPEDGSISGLCLVGTPTIPMIVEPDVADTSQKRSRAAWVGLRKSLQGLRNNAGVFPPLYSATGILLSCIERIEAASDNRQEYDELSTELSRLSDFLSQRMEGSYPSSKSFIGISKPMRLKSSLKPPQIDQLVRRSGALFIYAATLVWYIKSSERVDPQKRLKSLLGMTTESTRRHAQIDALYTAVLKSALNDEDLEEEEAEDVRVVLRTVLFAQEPISVERITALAEIDDPRRVSSALQPLRSVLHQSEQTGLVSTLHASFPDFMFNNERSGSYFCDVVEHSQILARRCFSVMKLQLRFNICNLSSSFLRDKELTDLDERIRTHISATLAYTCRHCANHLELAHSSDCLLKIMEEFLSNRFLFWMEVLNLREEMGMGVGILAKAKSWLMELGSIPELVGSIEDCRNFLTGYAANPVELDLQVLLEAYPGLLELRGSLIESREGEALAT